MDTEAVYLSTKDAADEIGVGPDRFRQLEREGKIPAIRTRGGVRLFRLSDVLVLKAQRAAQREEAHAR
jgi:excisionase family DNA binding protein